MAIVIIKFVRILTLCVAVLGLAGAGVSVPLSEVMAQAKSKSKKPVKQDFNNPRVAVVDVRRVLSEAKAAKDIRRQVEARRKQYDQEVAKSRQNLAKEQEDLRKKQAVLSPEAFDKRRQDLERKYRDLKRKAETYGRSLSSAFSQSERKLLRNFRNIVANMMQSKKIDVVLSRAVVLAFDERLNLTKEVLAELNKKQPKMAVKFATVN